MKARFLFFTIPVLLASLTGIAQTIPLLEHPRPDFMRDDWQNLNGEWEFEFDPDDSGIVDHNWQDGDTVFTRRIMVPFPWGSPLSGVGNEADIGWYKREFTIDPAWRGRRVFLTIGASDWSTMVWVDGRLLGTHQGGYVPFSFDLTGGLDYWRPHTLVIRVDDTRRDFTLYGKQGYGDARGIWQTVYLEARGRREYLDTVHFTPDIDRSIVTLTAGLPGEATRDLNLSVSIDTESGPITASAVIPAGKKLIDVDIPIPDQHLWSFDDPYLYDADVTLEDDTVHTYFGMRKISVVDLPGADYPYIALNDKPVYLQLALDQSYNSEGYYTFPSDAFMRAEVERAKSIGLNGVRHHVKVEVPRKLYWEDKLGLLVMQDLPNSWGEPDDNMKHEVEYTMREMIKRDYNHPSIFSWILFNEQWGLTTSVGGPGRNQARYLPVTQYWVASIYYLARSLDPTRLVEDNSVCCGIGHTETDIISYHEYAPGWQWENSLETLTKNERYSGNSPLFQSGFTRGGQPLINSECGNVWGYDGSTGDIDWSWDYHRMMNSFREYPEVAGWLYTELHDVVNEWNGYWRYDRTDKYPGLGEIMEGMTLADLHSPVYLSTGNEICRTVYGGDRVTVPLHLSSMTDADFDGKLKLSYRIELTDAIGETTAYIIGDRTIDYRPYMQADLDPLVLTIPDIRGLAVLKLLVEDMQGNPVHHNFMHFEVETASEPADADIVSVAADAFSAQQWSLKQWSVLDGLKENGAGEGYFEYTFPLPNGLDTGDIDEAYVLIELSAKQLFVKDMDQQTNQDINYMLGGRDAPSRNPNSYPMTDETRFPSDIVVSVNGHEVLAATLPDDPADHRGVLSWHHQLRDRKLREAGSYGYLVKAPVSSSMLREAAASGELTVRFATWGDGGIAVYGASFGRYPVDPSLVLQY